MDYSIATGRPLKYHVDDLYRMHIVCTKGCPFRLWLSYMVEYEGWKIKTVHDEHNCIYHYKNNLVMTNYLADLYGDRIRRNPNWKLSEMPEEFKRVLKVGVCDAKCCRVRKRALSGIGEEMVKHYASLRRFGGDILKSNKENTVKISTTRMNEQDSPCFQRFYVCYVELRKGWKEGCRPILGLDGCFLKTVCGGQLLSAVGRDGNNSIFPVAMAVVETESYDSWKWFLMLGLIKAVKELLPHIEHMNCTRHIYSNFGKKHGSEAVRNAFYDASDATHPEAFKVAMRDLEKASKKAWVIMNRFEPHVWSKAFFGTHCKIDSTENNISECFNSWILKSRFMPLIDMLTDIHDKIMERLHQKRDAMQNVDCIIFPRTRKILNDVVVASSECSVLWDGRHNFQVKWRGIGFYKSRLNPTDFVSHYIKKETYMKAYSHCLEVIRGEPFGKRLMEILLCHLQE
ncbi:uncharacterized protein LOC141719381 [Apium graveolens]|uniref:uncharacterized protein LOC141719381 n=1 Tax=Apium graveolens TaxID=4045 RepID=UPI003D7AF8D0